MSESNNQQVEQPAKQDLQVAVGQSISILAFVTNGMPEIPNDEKELQAWKDLRRSVFSDSLQLACLTGPKIIETHLGTTNAIAEYRKGTETKKMVYGKLVGTETYEGKVWLCLMTPYGTEKINISEAEEIWRDNLPSQLPKDGRKVFWKDGELNQTYGMQLLRTNFLGSPDPRAEEVRKTVADVLATSNRDVSLATEMFSSKSGNKVGDVKIVQHVIPHNIANEDDKMPESEPVAAKRRSTKKASTQPSQPARTKQSSPTAATSDYDWGDDNDDDWEDNNPRMPSLKNRVDLLKALMTEKDFDDKMEARQEIRSALDSLGLTMNDIEDDAENLENNLRAVWSFLVDKY